MSATARRPGLLAPWWQRLRWLRVPLVPLVLAVALGCLALLLAGSAAGWLPHLARPSRWGIGPWAALFLLGWMLMTGAMMLPSSLPFLAAAQRIGGGRASITAGAGFAAVWLAVGVLLWVALWLAGAVLTGLVPGQAERVAAGSLLAAAIYQISPLAQACQRACERPFALLARHWHGGPHPGRDAWVAGLHYGASCVGCCVPMILLMFVVGMHDMAWLLGLAALMLVQKHSAWGRHMAWPAALVLAVLAVALWQGWWAPELRGLREVCGA